MCVRACLCLLVWSVFVKHMSESVCGTVCTSDKYIHIKYMEVLGHIFQLFKNNEYTNHITLDMVNKRHKSVFISSACNVT